MTIGAFSVNLAAFSVKMGALSVKKGVFSVMEAFCGKSAYLYAIRLKLPIGLSDFRGLIEDGYQYIDKTIYFYKLCTEGKFYFFARSRRFGKSLMLTTLSHREAFYHATLHLIFDYI